MTQMYYLVIRWRDTSPTATVQLNAQHKEEALEQLHESAAFLNPQVAQSVELVDGNATTDANRPRKRVIHSIVL